MYDCLTCSLEEAEGLDRAVRLKFETLPGAMMEAKRSEYLVLERSRRSEDDRNVFTEWLCLCNLLESLEWIRIFKLAGFEPTFLE